MSRRWGVLIERETDGIYTPIVGVVNALDPEYGSPEWAYLEGMRVLDPSRYAPDAEVFDIEVEDVGAGEHFVVTDDASVFDLDSEEGRASWAAVLSDVEGPVPEYPPWDGKDETASVRPTRYYGDPMDPDVGGGP